jgi:hypothetical protein
MAQTRTAEGPRSEANLETHPQNSTKRGVLRWMGLALVTFGLGALLMVLLLYVPAQQKLNQVDAGLKQANAALTERSNQVTGLEADKHGLQKQLDAATMHLYLLKTLSGVRGASLGVASSDYAGVRLSLMQASAALDALVPLITPDQKDVVTAMQKDAAQALVAAKTDLRSAQPALDQLAKNMNQLENSLFPSP